MTLTTSYSQDERCQKQIYIIFNLISCDRFRQISCGVGFEHNAESTRLPSRLLRGSITYPFIFLHGHIISKHKHFTILFWYCTHSSGIIFHSSGKFEMCYSIFLCFKLLRSYKTEKKSCIIYLEYSNESLLQFHECCWRESDLLLAFCLPDTKG